MSLRRPVCYFGDFALWHRPQPEHCTPAAFAAKLVLPAELLEIGEDAFRGSGVGSVRIPDGCASIGASAFSECEALTWVYIPDSVRQIGSGAFANCPDLVLICGEESAAAEYAQANGLLFRSTGGET